MLYNLGFSDGSLSDFAKSGIWEAQARKHDIFHNKVWQIYLSGRQERDL